MHERTSTTRPRRQALVASSLLALPALLASCGAGSAAIASLGGDSGATAVDTPATVTFAVVSREVSPAAVLVTVVDPDGGAPVDLDFVFQDGQPAEGGNPAVPASSQPDRAMSLVEGDDFMVGEVEFEAGVDPQGISILDDTGRRNLVYYWDFETDLFPGSTGDLLEEVNTDTTLALTVIVNEERITEAPSYVGNDQPILQSGVPIGTEGVIGIPFIALDPSLDAVSVTIGEEITQRVSIRPEYDPDGDGPADFQPATSATVAEGLSFVAEEDGFITLLITAGETQVDAYVANVGGLQFPWDTDVDLGGQSGFFRFRLTVKDDFAQSGDELDTLEFFVLVDNASLAATIDGEAVVAGGDRRGAITIPFQFANVPREEARFVLQAEGPNGFASVLGDDFVASGEGEVGAALDALFADDALLAERGILPQLPFTAEVNSLLRESATEVEVPELADGASWFLGTARVGDEFSDPLTGSTLELRRDSFTLRSIADDWTAEAGINQIRELAVLGQGFRAVVARQLGNEWALSIVELDTGARVDWSGQGVGVPEAVAVDPTGSFVFVGADVGADWTVTRVALPPERATAWVAAEDSWSVGFDSELRAMEAIGTAGVVLASPDQLIVSHGGSLDDGGGIAPSSGVFLSGLQQVRDIELDGRDSRNLLVAHARAGVNTPGFLATVDLDTGAYSRRDYPGAIDDPRSLAQSDDLRSVFVLEREASSSHLYEVGYRRGVLEADALLLQGDGEVDETLPGNALRLRTAGGRTRVVLAGFGVPRLWGAGGVSSERTVVGYDTATRVLTLDRDLPAGLLASSNGLPRPSRLLSPALDGSQPIFLEPGRTALRWAADRYWPKGEVTLRIVPFSQDVQGGSSELNFDLTTDLDQAPDGELLGGSTFSGFPTAISTADLDDDGAPDLAFLRSESATVEARLFESTGDFESIGGVPVGASVAEGTLLALDADQNGDAELLFGAEGDVDSVLLIDFDPLSDSLFVADAIALPGIGSTRHLALADLDQDERADVVALDVASGTLRVYMGEGLGLDTFPLVESDSFATLAGDPARAVLHAADWTGDGVIDLAVAVDQTLRLHVGQLVDGAWSQTPSADVSTGAVGDLIEGTALDRDADGVPELALSFTAGSGEPHVRFFGRDASAAALVAVGVAGGSDAETPSSGFLASVDLDRDGRLELTTGGFGAVQGVEFYRDLVSDPITPVALSGAGPLAEPPTPEPVAHAFADFAGNGRADIVSGTFPGGGQSGLGLTVQGAPGEFRGGTTVDLGQQVRSDRSLIDDVNGDLLLDLVGVPPDDPSVIHVYSQNTPGLFAPVPSKVLSLDPQMTLGGLAVREPRRLRTADFNGDGLTDLLVLAEARYNGPLDPAALAAGAFGCGGDGPDFQFSDVRESSLVLFLGTHDGGLETQGQSFGTFAVGNADVAYPLGGNLLQPSGNGVRGFSDGDVNGDGLADLLVGYERTHPVVVCEDFQPPSGCNQTLTEIGLRYLSRPQDVGDRYTSTVLLYVNNGTDAPFIGVEPVVVEDWTPNTTFRFRDLTGDGLSDVLAYPIETEFALGNGGEFCAPVMPGQVFPWAYRVGFDRVRIRAATGTADPTDVTCVDCFDDTPVADLDEIFYPSENAVIRGTPGFDGAFQVVDWNLDGVPDLLPAGDGPTEAPFVGRLPVLDGRRILDGGDIAADAWDVLEFDLETVNDCALTANTITPRSVVDLDEDGLPDLSLTLGNGDVDQGPCASDPYVAEAALLLRVSPTFSDVETVILAPHPDQLALPQLQTLRFPQAFDVDQDGTFEILGLTTQPGEGGVVGTRQVLLFSDR